MKHRFSLGLAISLFAFVPSLSSCDDNGSKLVKNIAVTCEDSSYCIGETVDFHDITLDVDFRDGRHEQVNGMDSDVTISGLSTVEIGKKEATIEYLGAMVIYPYSVNAYQVTLKLDGGLIDGRKEDISVSLYNCKADISGYIPVSEDESMQFSGWYYDKDHTRRADTFVEGIVNSERDLTLYAGYDVRQSDRFNYVIDRKKGEATIVSINPQWLLFNPFQEELVIPSTVEGYPVTAIGPNLFYDSKNDIDYSSFFSVSKLTFAYPSYVETIGYKAFAGLNDLTDVVFPDSLVTIGDYAFSSTDISGTLNFGRNLRKIGKYAFSGCSNHLESVKFADRSQIAILGDYAFEYCTYLHDVSLPEGLLEIKDGVFSNCNDITSLYLPSTLKVLGAGSFRRMGALKKIEVSPFNPYYVSVEGNLFSKDCKRLIRYCYANSQSEYTLPSSVERIENSCFNVYNDYTNLTKLYLNEGLYYIGDDAFGGGHFSVALPSTLKSFSVSAFKDYNGESYLMNEDNPRYKVKDGILYSKDGSVLYSCPSDYQQSEFILDPGVMIINEYAFCDINNIRSFVIPQDSKLQVIRSTGLLLFSFRLLKTFSVRMNQPFSFSSDSFYDPEYPGNTTFVAYFSNPYVRDEFLSLSPSGQVAFSSLVVESDGLVDEVISEIESKFNFTDYLSYVKGARPSCYTDFNLSSDELQSLLSKLSLIYSENLYHENDVEYFGYFERYYYTQFYLQYVKNKAFNSLTLSVYQMLMGRYNVLPSACKSLVSPIMNRISQEFPEVRNLVYHEVYSRIIDFDLSKEGFDLDACEKILDEVDELGLEDFGLPDQIALKVYAIRVSYWIYGVLNEDVSSHESLRDIDFKVNYSDCYGFVGIKGFLQGYFMTEHRKKMLYCYDEFMDFVSKLPSLLQNDWQKIQNEIRNFDISATFDGDVYRSFDSDVLSYYFLSADENDPMYTKATKISCSLAIYDFFDSSPQLVGEDSDDGYLFDVHAQSEIIQEFLEILGDDTTGIYRYADYLIASEEVKSFAQTRISEIKSRIWDFVIDDEHLQTDFPALEETIRGLGFYASDVLSPGSEGEPDSMEHYYVIHVSYLIMQVLNTYQGKVEFNNFREVKDMIFGYFDYESFKYEYGLSSYIEGYLGNVNDITQVYHYQDYLDFLSGLEQMK